MKQLTIFRTAAGVAALSGFIALGTGCEGKFGKSSDTDEEETAPLPVETLLVSRGDINAVYSGTAALQVEAQSDVVSKVSGQIEQLLVEEGDDVIAGQVVARLDGDRLKLELARQRANVTRLEQDYKRNLELHQKGLVSAGAFEGLKYELEALRAAMRLAQLEVSYTEVRAPFDGVISARHVKRGNTVTVNQPLFTVTDMDPLLADLHVPEKDFNRLSKGQKAAVHVDALPGQTFIAEIKRISPVIDASSGTFKATLEIADDSGRLKPGMFGRISVVYDTHRDAFLIPRAALVDSDTDAAVFVVDNDAARRQPVTVGLAQGAKVEITEGLTGDEHIVVVGQNSLKDGAQVEVVGLEPADNRTVVEDTSPPNPAS